MNDYKVDALTTCELMPDELTPPPPPPPLPIQWQSAQSSDGTRLIWAKLAGTAVLGVGCDRP